MTEAEQDQAFTDAITRFGGALARMARAYEADADLRRDLEQDIQVALWQSLAHFDGRCALATWVWRVAHNRATDDRAMALIRSIIDRLDPPDRQILLLYLEGVAAAEIGQITGVSPDSVATKIHRFKTMLARRDAQPGEAS